MSSTSQLTTFSDTDLAWAAGFVDGEGCIAVVRPKVFHNGVEYYSYVLRLSVANTDLRCLERLKGMFLGTICAANHKKHPRRKPCWTWYCQAAKAESALISMMPYLFSKREQAVVGLEARSHIQSSGVRRTPESNAAQEAIYQRLRSMKRAA